MSHNAARSWQRNFALKRFGVASQVPASRRRFPPLWSESKISSCHLKLKLITKASGEKKSISENDDAIVAHFPALRRCFHSHEWWQEKDKVKRLPFEWRENVMKNRKFRFYCNEESIIPQIWSEAGADSKTQQMQSRSEASADSKTADAVKTRRCRPMISRCTYIVTFRCKLLKE